MSDKAAAAVAAAKSANAATHAPYEFTAAVAYLGKAREEGAYAEYQFAIEYGRKAEEFALRAREKAERAAAASPGASSAGQVSAPVSAPAALVEPPGRATDSL